MGGGLPSLPLPAGHSFTACKRGREGGKWDFCAEEEEEEVFCGGAQIALNVKKGGSEAGLDGSLFSAP